MSTPSEPGSDDQVRGARALEDVVAGAYAELRRLAAQALRRERRGHTLQTTALVHEAFLRLAQAEAGRTIEPDRLLPAAANAIRRVLVDHARRRGASGRGGDWRRVTLSDSVALSDGSGVDCLALDAALERLARLNERQSRVVELRFFAGLSHGDIARVLGVSTRTVDNEWAFARAWLARELERDAGA